MQLTRCQDQKTKTLDEFYTEISQSSEAISSEIGATMLALLARLRALPDNRRVYGLTSFYRLCLLAEDTYTSPWFVIISSLNRRSYIVEYLMPERAAAGPDVYVRVEPQSEDEAVQMILKAMEISEGWNAKS